MYYNEQQNCASVCISSNKIGEIEKTVQRVTNEVIAKTCGSLSSHARVADYRR